MRTDQERLKDILYFIDKILTEFNEEEYFRNETYRYGLLKYLEIIGEASRSLQQRTRDLSAVSWSEIISFRNIAVHAYHDLDWDAVIDIIKNHLEDLKDKIGKLLHDISHN